MRLMTMICCAALAVAGCSTVYRSSDVIPGSTDGTQVRVVPLTGETVIQANRAPYAPQSLPSAFSQSAGTGAGLAGRGVGVLPDAPSTQAGARNQQLVLNSPPPISPGAYRIGVGDVVMLATPSTGNTLEAISGLLAAQNSRSGYTVQDDGSINIPDVGRVRIAGLTIEDAEELLFQRLVEAQFDPTFSLEDCRVQLAARRHWWGGRQTCGSANHTDTALPQRSAGRCGERRCRKYRCDLGADLPGWSVVSDPVG